MLLTFNRVGGIAELIAPEDQDLVLFHPTAISLAQKLRYTMSSRIFRSVRFHAFYEPQSVRPRWLQAIESLAGMAHKQVHASNSRDSKTIAEHENVTSMTPLITVCIPTRNRITYLHQAVQSLKLQVSQVHLCICHPSHFRPDVQCWSYSSACYWRLLIRAAGLVRTGWAGQWSESISRCIQDCQKRPPPSW